MVILQFLIGILIASLAGMGVGGGGLLVIWLVFIANMSAPTAQGINLVFFIVSALCALPLHIKKRRLPWSKILFYTLTALPGAWIGCRLASVLPEMTARRCFGYFLLVSGTFQLYRQLKRNFSLDERFKS